MRRMHAARACGNARNRRMRRGRNGVAVMQRQRNERRAASRRHATDRRAKAARSGRDSRNHEVAHDGPIFERQRAGNRDPRRRRRIRGAAAAARPSPRRIATGRGARRRRLRDRLSGVRSHAAARGRDQGIHAVDARDARRRLHGFAALGALRAGVRRGPQRVSQRGAAARAIRSSGARQGPAFLGEPRHRVHGDAVLRRAHAQATARRRRADRRDAAAPHRRRAARRARHAASRAVLPSRHRARQHPDPARRQSDPARLRRGAQTDRRSRRRQRDDDQAGLCADRAVHRRSGLQPGALDRSVRTRRGDACDGHGRAAARGGRAQYPGYLSAARRARVDRA
ncbi:Uncharacterised protein [Burkholderia pseudomallei]|nr:Uncharacterised protein [Burkholderia pseudomallei]CAJ3234032.1 Uncharacterised protein [Burkholderia pseudomallei]CAJ3664969.1 Uncharacterised protein [Burkholderia pseudomallei]CAJ3713641.1 Uncharacterised protein [Burkholderia pseudomallei]CAJ3795114.1 Uncharacterised protein [Burkholderia pseudomallei]